MENILDQIFNTIDNTGKLKHGVFISSLCKLNPLADKIISETLQSGSLQFNFGDFLLLLTEIETASEETLIEISTVNFKNINPLDYEEIFKPFVDLKLKGKISYIYFAHNNWNDVYYDLGRIDKCDLYWLLINKKYKDITFEKLKKVKGYIHLYSYMDFVEYAEKERPDLTIKQISNSKKKIVGILFDGTVQYKTGSSDLDYFMRNVIHRAEPLKN